MTQPIDWTPRTPGAQWSVEVREAGTSTLLLQQEPHVLLQTASLGKVFILRRVAELLTKDPALGATRLPKPTSHMVGDSGLWHHLHTDTLPVSDLATLVASCSDNLASNALIEWVGLDRVHETAEAWVDGGSTLHDYFRDERDSSHAPTVSRGCAADYVKIMMDVMSSPTPELEAVRGWLSTSMDMSLVGAAVGIDPLSHYHPHGDDCLNKTGCDVGVRADAGIISGTSGSVVYAAICNWDGTREPLRLDSVLADMRGLGVALVNRVSGPAAH